MFRFSLSTLAMILISAIFLYANNGRIPKLETYITAQQADRFFSTSEDRIKALQVYQNIGISKVYLESLRSGYQPSLDRLRAIRDFLRDNGIEVSGGITTTAGNNFGVPSQSNQYWLNYQHPKTQSDMAAHLRKVAPLYDEIIVDDFLATDDESPMSQKAKADRDWPEYRLNLMADFAQRFIIQPAREANPDIQVIEKFPQWYDRFHIFGYNVLAAPELFDRIWVGTETRNPDTKRFGFVMPTEGYVNYRWLASIAKDKIAGAWFDFGDCVPGPYLMQAYQSALAGAKEIVLFETGSLIEDNPCLKQFMKRRNALFALGGIVNNKSPKGMYAYKPANSNGSDANGAANLYIFDYIATLGLAPLPVAEVPDDAACIFLPRQAADDPKIVSKFHQWVKAGIQIVVTNDFLQTIHDPSIPNILDKENPSIFSTLKIQSHTVWVLNLQTFRHEEFGPGKEMFLPPRPLPVCDWPEEEVNKIRKEILSIFDMEITGPNNTGVYLFEDDLLVLANFNDSPAACSVKSIKTSKAKFRPHTLFEHDEAVSFQSSEDSLKTVIPPWEIAVITRNE